MEDVTENINFKPIDRKKKLIDTVRKFFESVVQKHDDSNKAESPEKSSGGILT